MYFNFGSATEAVQTSLDSLKGREMMELKQFIAEDMTAATEAIDRISGNRKDTYTSKYASYLIKRVEARVDGVDFGTIPNTKGNIMKWNVHQYVASAIDLGKSFAPNNETVRCADELYRHLVELRPDFEYGYKTNNSFIVLTYQSACLALVDVAMLALIEAENEVLGPKGAALIRPIKPAHSARTLMKSVRSLNTVFGNGEWSKMIRAFRTTNINKFKATTAVAREAVVEYTPALEFASALGVAIIVASVSITGLIAVVGAIRGLITIYYRTAVKIDTKARSMQQYLDETMPYEQNVSALEKQRKAYAILEKLSGFIEGNIIKDDNRASEEIRREDAQGLSPASLQSIEPVEEFSEFSFS